jgi:aspartyl-tRNA(Asn)/glutamyl-tRNA(Gln) amidotransferase subunit A
MLRSFLAQHMAAGEVLLLPALPHTVSDWSQVTPGDAAFDLRRLLGLHRYMGFANYLGLPAMVLPVAMDKAGRPVSAQLVAGPHREAQLLSLASRIESMRDGAGRSAALPM